MGHRRGAHLRLVMADVFTIEKRSAVMSRIRSQGNKDTELRLISLMRAAGITGWRRNGTLPGRPDFVFRVERVVIFVDGCFWHGCPRCYRCPRSNRKYWRAKVDRNRRRDRQITRLLRRGNWQVVRIWEHQLDTQGHRRSINRLQRLLSSASRGVEYSP
jgi:DNA mismatch endonuclease, patch repair protein